MTDDLTPPAPLPPSPHVNRNRAVSPILPEGATDVDVVRLFLSARSAGANGLSKHTLATYRLECERIFWYCARVVVKSLSAWLMQDVIDYLQYLRDVPDDVILKIKTVSRGAPGWTPFRGKMSDASIVQAQKVLLLLLRWMTDVGYLRVNPSVGLPKHKPKHRDQLLERVLPEETCRLVLQTLLSIRPATDRERLRLARDVFVLRCLLYTGLRTNELIKATMGDFVRVTEQGETFMALLVRFGKGGKTRTVPADRAWEALMDYRVAFGLAPEPMPGDDTPLILSPFKGAATPGVPTRQRALLREHKGITSRQGLHLLVTKAFKRAKDLLEKAGKTYEAHVISEASTHWLRHSYATMLGNHGASVLTIAENLGQSDINVTRRYTHLNFRNRAEVANTIDMP
ncbi:tyrosine-type recombinase/integrase [Burkholderia cepacia]|uniref:tyrosine-type recombinase/integrase n=1 Tax=Burkholderia cepacia TaxID=292 RepID=UPI002AB69684|nr:tyrosine-type recombinase/integrase [Burkholderia cepacia]